MTIQEKINNDLHQSIKLKSNITSNLKVIVGELQRNKKKILTDDEVIQILKKLKNNELELLKLMKKETSEFLDLLDVYIPEQASEKDIKEWISKNIDFTELKNHKQAIGITIKHFGSLTNGEIVTSIINNMSGEK